jgi:hypothetical protein
MREFWQSLKRHPGMPIASYLSALGLIAGMDGGFWKAIGGFSIMSVFWIPVLITAWTGRKQHA